MYSNSVTFWEFMGKFKFIQFATYAQMFKLIKNSKPRTIRNNFRAMTVFSEIYAKHKIKHIDVDVLA